MLLANWPSPNLTALKHFHHEQTNESDAELSRVDSTLVALYAATSEPRCLLSLVEAFLAQCRYSAFFNSLRFLLAHSFHCHCNTMSLSIIQCQLITQFNHMIIRIN